MPYKMPTEDQLHEGTWLQWPHQHEYGTTYRNRLDATWVAMTQALVAGEKVHLIAYDATEQTRITNLLTAVSIPLANIDFKLFKTNDVWVRDNGPIFVRDTNQNLLIEDWGFNGWGGKFNSNLCNPIPASVGAAIGTPVVNLNAVMTVEGGALEQDGNGVLLATKSSILSQSPANTVRNLGMTQAQAETIFTQYLGVTKFIWLNGVTGGSDITDMHIDGFAKFVNDSTMVTMNNTDLTYWLLPSADITTLNNASNRNNRPYNFVYVPLTANDVVTTYGNNLGYKGSYVNYYVANTVVLVPNYNDPNDTLANNIIQALYPTRTVIGIDVRNLYLNGGMVHCVTQQQPVAINTTGVIEPKQKEVELVLVFPNPANNISTIQFELQRDEYVSLEMYNPVGQLIETIVAAQLQKGKYSFTTNINKFQNGTYTYLLKQNKNVVTSRQIIIAE